MDTQDLLHKILRDLNVELLDELKKNFQRKAFFSLPWQDTKKFNYRGSLMLRSGSLHESLNVRIVGNGLEFSSSEPYADIHNSGGIISRTSTKGKSYQISMPQRQFIGYSTEVEEIINDVATEKCQEYVISLLNNNLKLQ